MNPFASLKKNPFLLASILLLSLYAMSVVLLASFSGQPLEMLGLSLIYTMLQVPAFVLSRKKYYFGLFVHLFAIIFILGVLAANYLPFSIELGNWPFAIGFVSMEAMFLASLLSLILVFADLKINEAAKKKWQLIFVFVVLADCLLLLATGKSGFKTVIGGMKRI